MKLFIGIDPGFKGALAIIDENENIIDCVDCPVLEEETSKTKINKKTLKKEKVTNNRVNVVSFIETINKYKNNEVIVLVERARPMPEEGVSSVGRYLEGYGMYLGALLSTNFTVYEVGSRIWKNREGLDSDKKKSLALVKSALPESSKYVYLVKHDGRAEALLIARFCKNNYDKNHKGMKKISKEK